MLLSCLWQPECIVIARESNSIPEVVTQQVMLLSYLAAWMYRCSQRNQQYTRNCDSVGKASFTRAKFLCHILHTLQSLLSDFCGIITVNLYSRTDTYEKWTNNNYRFGINDCSVCNLWERKFGCVLEPIMPLIAWMYRCSHNSAPEVMTQQVMLLSCLWQPECIGIATTIHQKLWLSR